jgi:hypothetical protein
MSKTPIYVRPVVNERVGNKIMLAGIAIIGEKAKVQHDQRNRRRAKFPLLQRVPLPVIPAESHPLYGAILKLHVANDEIERLDASMKSLLDGASNTVVFDDDSKRPYKLVRLSINNPPDPKWSAQVGSIAHHLRSALNIALNGLLRGRPGNSRYRKHAPDFPIKTSYFDRHRTLSNGNSRRISGFQSQGREVIALLRPEYRKIIEDAQPYKAGNLRYRHPLWILHRINGTDKHKIIVRVETRVSGAQIDFFGGGLFKGFRLYANVRFEDGAIVGRVAREMQMKPSYSVRVRFDKTCSSIAYEPVIEILRRIEKEVREIIVSFHNV